MTRSRTSTNSTSVSQDGQGDATSSRPATMHRTVSFNTLPETQVDLSTKEPHSRRVSKSKTCSSFMPQTQQQGDVELATSIGHDLLLEVKKMQGLLQEKNDSLTALSLEKADTQQEIEQLTKQLKQCSESLELEKEQIWNLELEKQELTQQVDDLQQQVKRNVVDQAKLTDQESDLKQELEQLKQQQSTWQEAMEQSNQDKVDLAIARRKLAALQRQVSSNKAMVDASRVSYQADTFRFSLPPDPQLNLSHLTPSESSPSSSTPAGETESSITKNVRQQQRQQQDEFININAELQASLQAANETIQALQHSLEGEQKKRTEMELLWRDAQQAIENKIGDDSNPLPLPSSSPLIGYQHFDFDNVPGLDQLNDQKNAGQRNRRLLSKESRHNRQKCLSLGDELSLAGPGGIFSTFDLDSTETNDGKVLEASKIESLSPEPATKKWPSETLTNQNNLDGMVNANTLTVKPTSLSHHTNHGNGGKNDRLIKNGKNNINMDSIHNDISKSNDGATSNGSLSIGMADSHHKQISRSNSKQNYGSILATESYIYKTSLSPDSSQHEDKDTSTNTSDLEVEKNSTEGKESQQITGRNSGKDGKQCIRALTRTMIGNWMWKYTRKVVGNGISENRHKRFFWLHPYSKTLYWSTQEPGTDGYEHNTKCVMIESFMVIDDGHVTSFYIQTSGRGIKIQCTDEMTHREWFKSLKYLLIDAPPLSLPAKQDQQSFDTSANKTMQQLKMSQQRLTKLLRYHPPNMTTHGTRSVARLRPDCQHAFATMSAVSPRRRTSQHLDSTLSALAAATSSNHSSPSLQPAQSPESSTSPLSSASSQDETTKTRSDNHRFGSLTPIFMKLAQSRRDL